MITTTQTLMIINVEDSEPMRAALTRLLRQAGFQKGDKAFHIIDERNPGSPATLKSTRQRRHGRPGRRSTRGARVGKRASTARIRRPARHARPGRGSIDGEQTAGLPLHPLDGQYGVSVDRPAQRVRAGGILHSLAQSRRNGHGI
jgi:hypothetical protein